MSKTGDELILRPNSRGSPSSVSTGASPRQKRSKVLAPRDTKLDSARELTKSNPTLTRSSKPKKPQNLLHQTRQGQNKPGSEIGISDSRSRNFHEGPYA